MQQNSNSNDLSSLLLADIRSEAVVVNVTEGSVQTNDEQLVIGASPSHYGNWVRLPVTPIGCIPLVDVEAKDERGDANNVGFITRQKVSMQIQKTATKNVVRSHRMFKVMCQPANGGNCKVAFENWDAMMYIPCDKLSRKGHQKNFRMPFVPAIIHE